MSSRKLTIGMLTASDFDGVWFSIQSIRLYHPEVLDEIEFLILDNNPDGPHGQAVQRFSKWVKEPIRYIPLTDATGTALRTRIFELAETPYVLCMDSHVMLQAGALRQLIDGMDDGRDEGNLLQGPMLADNMNVMATHMSEVWRGGMLGIWAVAWRCACGKVFQTAKREAGDGNWLELQTMSLPHRAIATCEGCGEAFPVLRWEGHESSLETAGFAHAANGGPFEIPAQGLGLFACRKDVWPGFHPGFRDFGGEECYIHEKFRQRGKTTICLPFLRWLHRFERPAGIPYANPWESRIMNYLLGHVELGIDPMEVTTHFSAFLQKDIHVDWLGKKPISVKIGS